jgi:hypothetical protein
MSITPTVAPSPDYEERRQFCESIKRMSRFEHIEIARILRRAEVAMSENRSGIFFDMAKLDRVVFDELVHFCEFVTRNTNELSKRDGILNSLKNPGHDE